ncbi:MULTISPECIES: hypothetical protein [Micromonospora]|uniref:Thrombospondin n=1 Tax=Micromonospora yangpuensis TaxID=683228 RepID=A0A1C6V8C1_9ACTN|nr:hypothetical protein [Micromonospora yangpuensis]GGM28847.1 hypothetical protein GCM10012279_54390 [Micromonospora yangpuensis]SCL62334.1 hypothetical protein GA0070617_4897 [Micromonospora yangpuensis]
MRIPSLSRRKEPTPEEQDSPRDGAVATEAHPDERVSDAERRAAERGAVARAATARPTEDNQRRKPLPPPPPAGVDSRTPGSDRSTDDPARTPVDAVTPTDGQPPVVAGPKPRASLLATVGLVVSVAGALFVLTGTLAGYGIGLGALGAVVAVLGLIATRRRHVAGKTDALIGMLVGLAAVVIGVLAMTGQFEWPTTDGDTVLRFREWLDSQFVDRF